MNVIRLNDWSNDGSLVWDKGELGTVLWALSDLAAGVVDASLTGIVRRCTLIGATGGPERPNIRPRAGRTWRGSDMASRWRGASLRSGGSGRLASATWKEWR